MSNVSVCVFRFYRESHTKCRMLVCVPCFCIGEDPSLPMFQKPVCFVGLDVDECAVGSDDCQQICTNQDGGFLCSCEPGYSLTKDMKTCTCMLHQCSRYSVCS